MEEETFMFPRSAHRVQKFTADGQWLASWGSRGSADGEFGPAMVIAVDADDNLYVSDWGNGRVQVFDSDGNYLDQIGNGGTRDGEFTTPTGVKVDRDGNIWVVDHGNHRVQKFT